MSNYGNLPTFTHGQVLSAAFHVNGLQRYIQGLRDEFVGYQQPHAGCFRYLDAPYRGAFRHKVNGLDYSVILGGGVFPWRLYVNDEVKVEFTYAGLWTGTIDLTSMALTLNQFYEVQIKDGQGILEVHYVRQSSALSFPALASFANETTPTAAQWQALPNYAAVLASALDAPSAATPQVHGKPAHPGILYLQTFWVGTMNHRCRYLAYKFWQRAPFHLADDGGEPWVSTYIGINGTGILHRRNGRATIAGPGLDFDQSNENATEWSGLVDLDIYPGTLTPGTDYLLTVTSQCSTTLDTITAIRVDSLYEAPDAGQTFAGWTAFETWTDNYVWGDLNPYTAARKITTSKSNLALLGAAVPRYVNPVAQLGEAGTGGTFTDLFGVRKRRFLHYKNNAGRSCSIVWTYRGEEQSAGLPDASERWLALDMESLNGLWPGTPYALREVLFALEDDEP